MDQDRPLYHCRITTDNEIYGTFIFKYFKNFVTVTHDQDSHHYHIVGQLTRAWQTVKNYCKNNFPKNTGHEFKNETCNEGMIQYLFHPGSNWANYRTDYLTDEKKLQFINGSRKYYEEYSEAKRQIRKAKAPSDNIVENVLDLFYTIVQYDEINRWHYLYMPYNDHDGSGQQDIINPDKIVYILMYRYCMANNIKLYTGSLRFRIAATVLARLGYLTESVYTDTDFKISGLVRKCTKKEKGVPALD